MALCAKLKKRTCSKGIRLAKVSEINVLQYADDMIFIGEVSARNVTCVQS